MKNERLLAEGKAIKNEKLRMKNQRSLAEGKR